MRLSRVSRRYPCPICGKHDWCAYNEKIAICMRVQSPYPTANGGWKHRLDGVRETPEPYVPAQNSRRDDGDLDRVYRRLLDLLPLKEGHRLHLAERGMTPREIAAGMYRSLPGRGRYPIVDRLAEGFELTGIPGFGYKRDRLIMAGPPGLVIPVVSPEGLIVSLLIRPDVQKRGRKYIYLSSRWLEGGSSPGTRYHLAVVPKVDEDPLWITEGPLKANICAARLERPVLAVPGVSNWKGIFKLALLRRTHRVVMAYDGDYENYSVRYHARKLADALICRGHSVMAATWNGVKGLDDALVSKTPIKLTSVK